MYQKNSCNHEPEIQPNGNMLVCLPQPNRYVEINRKSHKVIRIGLDDGVHGG
ncbi:MAG: hypothetical protein ABW168_00620 [Sedimenticola sp.]